MSKFIPTVVTPGAAATTAKLPRKCGQSRAPFFLQVHPREWSWHEQRGWVPTVGRLFITPGVMGVSTPRRPGAGVDASPAVNAAERMGWIVLKPQELYLRSLPMEGGGLCYFTAWDTPDEYHGAVEWEYDESGFLDYLLALVGDGPGQVIPPCSVRLKSRKISAFEKRVRRLEKTAADNTANANLQHRFVEASEQLAAMREDLERGNADPKVSTIKAPTTRRVAKPAIEQLAGAADE